ncbi:unnamed protein product [Microthlaspi erraticum]|uniref:MATH domain-containing protein n=1 Tax=Microthlaspi erraticum TaxID=1685480 RepID=A0A6D2HUX8_9BRAS|nr:unnamed protein product [Microthlaspi erraticum]
MWNQKPRFRFEINTFSKKEAGIVSPIFEYGGCEWCLNVWPKGDRCDDHLSLFLRVANPESLRTGWKRNVKLYFVVLNQSENELYRSSIGQTNTLFCAESQAWGVRKVLPLSKFPENGSLIIEVYIDVVEAIDGEGTDVSQKKEAVDINGFQAFASHVTSVKKVFTEHVVKTEYKNVLINACSKLSELAELGSKMDWLKSKLDEVSLKRKKEDDEDGSRFQQLEERIKNLELMESGSKIDSLKSELGEISLERKKSCDADRSLVRKLEENTKKLELMEREFEIVSLKSKIEEMSLERKKLCYSDESLFKTLEERIKNLEMMESGFKINCLENKLDEISMEREKSYDADGSRVQKLEERIKNLELMESGFKIDCLKSKLEEISLEKKKSYDADESLVKKIEEFIMNLELIESGLKSKLEEVYLERKRSDDDDGSRVQQHEDRIKNLELVVSDLKVELDKEKTKSFVDGFLLVDDVA